jgi:autotransporter-associated beta strand protein
LLGDDVQGSGALILGNTMIANFNSLSLSNAAITLAVTNSSVPNITVTNLNLGDGGAGTTINIAALPATIGLTQFPLIKYGNLTGTYTIGLGSLPPGFGATLINNTPNKSIDLQITALPSGTWNGGDIAVDGNWSDSLNWNGTALTGYDPLTFAGTIGLHNTNDTSETATSITFASGAGAFSLYGNVITLNGDINNNSANPQTINLAQTLNTTVTNYNFNGGSSGLTLNSNLTGSAAANIIQQVQVTGNAVINGALSSGTVDPTSGLRLNVTNGNSDTFGLSLGGNNTSVFGGQLFVSRGVMNYGSPTEAPVMTITRVPTGSIGEFLTVGDVIAGGATFNMNNGSLTLNDGQLNTGTTSVRLALANMGNATNVAGTAAWNQTAGTVTLQGFDLGSSPGVFGANQPGATTTFTISGGTFDAGDAPIMPAVRGIGSLTISGSGVLKSTGSGTNAAGAVLGVTVNDDRMVAGNLQSVGTLNLNAGGTLIAPSIRMTADRGGVAVNANLNFNGGTWRFNTNGANLFAAGTNGSTFVSGANYTGNDILAVTVQAGGAIIDDNGFTGAINMPLLHDATLGVTPDGGLTVIGSGTVTLGGINTYTGNTIVGAGTLALSGAGAVNNSANLIISNSATFDVSAGTNGTLTLTSGQTLQTATNGTLTGSLTNGVGSTVSPGGSGALGTLAVSGNVAFLGSSAMELSKTAFVTNDLVTATGSITFGGILNVSVLTGTPALGDSFQLFNAASFTGTFSTLNLPSLGTGLAWNWNPANGTLSVISSTGPGTFTQPTGITGFSLNGANVVINGTNGQSGDAYYLLQSTNVALPLSQWKVVATNVLGANGNYTFTGTNVLTPGVQHQFFILSNTNSNP